MSSRIFPLFPLADTVLFPATSLPLQVFEPRYREMVRDAIADEEQFVVSLASGNGFFRLGTVGRIHELEPLPDGSFKLRLEGIERVALTEVPSDTPYRQVLVEPRPECAGTDDISLIEDARFELLASYGILRKMLVGTEPCLLPQGIPFEVVVNAACASLPIEAQARQRLLSADSLIDRQRRGLQYLAEIIETLSWLRANSSANADSLVN